VSTPCDTQPHCWGPIEGDLHWRASRRSDLLESLRATGDPDSMTTCGVSMKTSSETESVATRPLDPGEEIDLTEEYPFKPLSDQEPAGLPSPCHERDPQRIAR